MEQQLSLSDSTLSAAIRPELRTLFKCYLNSLFPRLEHGADNRRKSRKSRNGGERGLVKRRVNRFEGVLSVSESENGRRKCGKRNTIR